MMAKQNLAKAIELDPNYARAYAGIAVCDSRLRSHYGVDIPAEDILANAAKALAIDPNLAEAHAVQGFALAVCDRRADAVAAFERALSLDPDNYEANRYYAEFCVTEGQFDLAAKLFMRAMEAKPADCVPPIMLVNVFRSLGQPEQAESYGRIGIRKAEEELKLHPENANVACLGAIVLAFLGERDKALEWLTLSLVTEPDDINIQYNAACTYSQLGELERAIDILESWMKHAGSEMKLWFRNDSDLDPIRAHARYRRLLELSENSA